MTALATVARLAASRCLGRVTRRAPGHVSPGRSTGLVTGKPGLGQCAGSARAKRGAQDIAQAVGPNPTDRGKQGTKRHVVVDAKGTPLCAVLSGANVNDHLVLEEAIEAIPPIRNGKPGRPRRRPDKMHADKAYDFDVCRQALLERGIVPRIARRGIESSERLGRFRWVVERTQAWLSQYRRLKIRYEQRDDIHQVFLSLGCALICLKQLHRFC